MTGVGDVGRNNTAKGNPAIMYAHVKGMVCHIGTSYGGFPFRIKSCCSEQQFNVSSTADPSHMRNLPDCLLSHSISTIPIKFHKKSP